MIIHYPAGMEGGEEFGGGKDVVVAGGGVDCPPGEAFFVGVQIAEAVGVTGFEEAGHGQAKDDV